MIFIIAHHTQKKMYNICTTSVQRCTNVIQRFCICWIIADLSVVKCLHRQTLFAPNNPHDKADANVLVIISESRIPLIIYHVYCRGLIATIFLNWSIYSTLPSYTNIYIRAISHFKITTACFSKWQGSINPIRGEVKYMRSGVKRIQTDYCINARFIHKM